MIQKIHQVLRWPHRSEKQNSRYPTDSSSIPLTSVGWLGFCQEDIQSMLLIHPRYECENIFCALPTAAKHQDGRGNRMLALYAFKTDCSPIFLPRISSSQQLCNDENQPTEYLLQLDFHSVY